MFTFLTRYSATVNSLVMEKARHGKIQCLQNNFLQGGHSPIMIKFPDFSRHFKKTKASITPRNSSDMTSIGNNFNYFPKN